MFSCRDVFCFRWFSEERPLSGSVTFCPSAVEFGVWLVQVLLSVFVPVRRVSYLGWMFDVFLLLFGFVYLFAMSASIGRQRHSPSSPAAKRRDIIFSFDCVDISVYLFDSLLIAHHDQELGIRASKRQRTGDFGFSIRICQFPPSPPPPPLFSSFSDLLCIFGDEVRFFGVLCQYSFWRVLRIYMICGQARSCRRVIVFPLSRILEEIFGLSNVLVGRSVCRFGFLCF